MAGERGRSIDGVKRRILPRLTAGTGVLKSAFRREFFAQARRKVESASCRAKTFGKGRAGTPSPSSQAIPARQGLNPPAIIFVKGYFVKKNNRTEEAALKISDMIPYGRNAWDNSDSVREIANSIEDFGFRGRIKLWRPDNPVIVSGHHRVKACELLGWDEIPDENIEFCEDLTEAQVKAFRLADNKTGQGGRWNRGLEKSEVKSLEGLGFDMSRFKFDFGGRKREYGAERLRTDKAYNLDICSARDCDASGMPRLGFADASPESLIAFNYVKTAEPSGAFVHFFIDDYQFERLWANPRGYIGLLKRFGGALSPDFSLYMDMPLPMQRWNEYRRRALMRYWQLHGITVIPTLSWTTPESYGFCFDGIPEGSTVAVSTVGVKGDGAAIAVWRDGMEAAMKTIRPGRVILYGGSVGFDFGAAEVIEYAANAAFGG